MVLTSWSRRCRGGRHAATIRELALEYTRLRPRDIAGWAYLARALTDLGQYSKARVALERWESLGRDEDSYVVQLHWGGYYKTIGDLKRAERCYRKAAATAPLALIFLGGVVARQGRLVEAKQSYRRATRVPDDDRVDRDEAFCNLGLIYRAERRYREALNSLERAIRLDPKYSAALEAQADLEAALKVEVPEENAVHWRRMLDAMGSHPATAHELVRAYTRRYPRESAGWVVFADVLAGFARYDEAIEALRKGERLARSETWREPPDHHFAVQWGLLYEKRKDFKRAQLMFRRAVLLRPSATNLTYLAEALVVQGQHTEARRHLERAIRLGPSDPSVAHYHLALIARARGQYADALRSLNAAIRHSPDYPLAVVARLDVREAMKVAGRR